MVTLTHFAGGGTHGGAKHPVVMVGASILHSWWGQAFLTDG